MVGVRRGFAQLILAFYVVQFAMVALLGPGALLPCYAGLAACYGLAFMGLSAEWFWARWFAMGVGQFGSLILLVLPKVGFEPILVFVGVTHLLVTLLLLGEGMAARYEFSEGAQERWKLQEESLATVRKAVKSAGSTLPLLILYALAPRPEPEQLLALGLGVAGVVGVMRGRTWGVFAWAAAGVIALSDGLGLVGRIPRSALDASGLLHLASSPCDGSGGTGLAILAGALLLVPMALLAKPMARYIARRA